jgi:hypothetical protein
MSVARALATILACVAIGAAVGTGVAWAASALSPRLIGAMIPRLAEVPEAEQVRATVALGLLNGTMWGAGLGAVIVAAVTWYETR